MRRVAGREAPDAAPVGVSTPVQAGPAPTAPATTDPAPATQASATQPPSGQVATDPAPADRLTRVAASATDDAAAVPPAPAPTATTQAAQVSSVTPLAPVAFARTAPVLAPQGEATAQRVTAQVFPEVVRVSGAGVEGGPRRVTLKLNPETLGEVHVVLTQRRGGLEISLAAGQDARQAITEGAPELHRLLESVGRGDARIVLRDLPASAAATVATPTPDGGAARTDVSTDLGGDAWSGAGRPGGEPATDREATRYRTPGSSTATDGIPAATIPSRSSTTDESRRPGGLDMSI